MYLCPPVNHNVADQYFWNELQVLIGRRVNLQSIFESLVTQQGFTFKAWTHFLPGLECAAFLQDVEKTCPNSGSFRH